MRWRWDQGRLEYFKFNNIRAIARTLHQLEGTPIGRGDGLLRPPLERGTGLPFLPNTYTVWRNYARVFQCAMLATKIDGRLVTTDICKKLSEESCEGFSSDEYFNFVFSRFQFPFPAFVEYTADAPPVFPFVSIIKYALTHFDSGCSLADVFRYVIGNNCSGDEGLGHYQNLQPTDRVPLEEAEERQVREMLIFMGQISYLKWFNGQLFADSTDTHNILNAIEPNVMRTRKDDALEEFLSLTSLGTGVNPANLDIVLTDRMMTEQTFFEGRKTFAMHGKIERSPLIRREFFKSRPNIICDACSMQTSMRYPWTDNNLLELHHILPLSATLNVGGTTTSMSDLVPLCPSCHKGIHVYYAKKLNEWDIPDFDSMKMATDVYNKAKQEIRL